ncbi:LysR family transcriptional regulator [Marivivens sp. LCG002]|uniref:LysR family transcriptional regulator n=1 Tax=Marivivens sp. LCG002 TaxID=3051171 RepID=UPI0025579D44|nr:LysR family transcriptional regulator [Marivivens sp. LCG002]WIV51545.1 LysR family transcriptional regulator [Marivivens sp. LCG002]
MNFTRQLKPAHLQLLLKIAEVGQLQIAASALAMSQPAASRIVADIEARAQTTLFHRSPKGLEPTPVGEMFLRHARVIVSELESLQKEVENLNAGLSGEVRIGTVTGPAVGIVLPVYQSLSETSPDIAVTIEVSPSTELVRGLDEGRFDFIVARIPTDHNTAEFLVHPGRKEVVQLMVRSAHPLAGRQQITLSDLSDYDWVIQERGSPIRKAVEDAFHASSLAVPNRVVNSSSLLVVEALLASSDVIAPQSKEVSDLLTGSGLGNQLDVLHLEKPITVPPYFVIRNRSRQLTRAASLFFDRILEAL